MCLKMGTTPVCFRAAAEKVIFKCFIMVRFVAVPSMLRKLLSQNEATNPCRVFHIRF